MFKAPEDEFQVRPTACDSICRPFCQSSSIFSATSDVHTSVGRGKGRICRGDNILLDGVWSICQRPRSMFNLQHVRPALAIHFSVPTVRTYCLPWWFQGIRFGLSRLSQLHSFRLQWNCPLQEPRCCKKKHLIAMASNLIVMASNLTVMASNLIAMASLGLQFISPLPWLQYLSARHLGPPAHVRPVCFWCAESNILKKTEGFGLSFRSMLYLSLELRSCSLRVSHVLGCTKSVLFAEKNIGPLHIGQGTLATGPGLMGWHLRTGRSAELQGELPMLKEQRTFSRLGSAPNVQPVAFPHTCRYSTHFVGQIRDIV